MGERQEEVDDPLRGARELRPQVGLLGGDADGAGIEMTLPRHHAAERHHRRAPEPELLRAEHRRDHDVPGRLQPAVDPDPDATPEVVRDQRLLGLGEPEFPRHARVLDRVERRGARAAVAPGDVDGVGVGLGDPRGDRPDPGLADELDGDPRPGVPLLEIVDQLGQVLDAVDVVVGRRGDERDPGLGAADARDLLRHLRPGDLAPLAGLAALRHLDLELLRRREILGRHPEASGRHLLDRAVRPVPVGAWFVSGRVLAALAAAAPRAEPVHRDRQGLVRLLAEGAVRHRRDDEPPDDRLRRLDPLHRERGRRSELQEVPQRRRRPVHHLPRVGEVVLVAAAEGQPVQGPDDAGVEGVVLSVLAKPEQPRIAEREGRRIAERPPVALQHVLRDLPEPDPAQARGRAGEGELDKGVVQPDGLEDLGAVVAADRGDAHLGHHLEEASLDHAAVPREGVRRLAPGPRRLRRDRLVHEVRIDGAGSVADQRRDLVDVPRFSGLRHQAHPHPQAPADEFLVHRPHGQEHRDGRLPRSTARSESMRSTVPSST